jgi:hypothetical protein
MFGLRGARSRARLHAQRTAERSARRGVAQERLEFQERRKVKVRLQLCAQLLPVHLGPQCLTALSSCLPPWRSRARGCRSLGNEHAPRHTRLRKRQSQPGCRVWAPVARNRLEPSLNRGRRKTTARARRIGGSYRTTRRRNASPPLLPQSTVTDQLPRWVAEPTFQRQVSSVPVFRLLSHRCRRMRSVGCSARLRWASAIGGSFSGRRLWLTSRAGSSQRE